MDISGITNNANLKNILETSQANLGTSFSLKQHLGGSNSECRLSFDSYGKCEGDTDSFLRLNFEIKFDDLYGSLPFDEEKVEEIEDLAREELQDDQHENSIHDLLVSHGVPDGLDSVMIAVIINGSVQRSIWETWTPDA